MKKRNIYLGFFLTVIIASCLTININFPAAAVQEAANRFVEDVQTSEAPSEKSSEKTPEKKKSPEQGWLQIEFMRNAYAQAENAIQINTPEAQRIKKAMKSRYAQIAKFKDKGAIGEGKDGFMVERDVSKLPLPERAKVKQLVKGANADRMALYKEIMRANSYPNSKMKEIKNIFAKSWQKSSKAGWWIQNMDGSWAKK